MQEKKVIHRSSCGDSGISYTKESNSVPESFQGKLGGLGLRRKACTREDDSPGPAAKVRELAEVL